MDKTDVCPEGWYRFEDSCYENKLSEMSWYGAAVHCYFHNGAHPTHIDSPEEKMFSEEFGDYSKWVGHTNINANPQESKTWVNCHGDTTKAEDL